MRENIIRDQKEEISSLSEENKRLRLTNQTLLELAMKQEEDQTNTEANGVSKPGNTPKIDRHASFEQLAEMDASTRSQIEELHEQVRKLKAELYE